MFLIGWSQTLAEMSASKNVIDSLANEKKLVTEKIQKT
jgi:hypothetical protein